VVVTQALGYPHQAAIEEFDPALLATFKSIHEKSIFLNIQMHMMLGGSQKPTSLLSNPRVQGVIQTSERAALLSEFVRTKDSIFETRDQVCSDSLEISCFSSPNPFFLAEKRKGYRVLCYSNRVR
jgi:hypothetical protein